MILNLGDRVKMRKMHPCGTDEWIVTRVGADIKIQCTKCGHVVMLERPDFEKKVRKILEQAKGSEDK